MMPEKPQRGYKAGHKGIFPCQMSAKVAISDCISLCQGSECHKLHVFPGGTELKQTHLCGLENSNLYSTLAQSMILAHRNIS